MGCPGLMARVHMAMLQNMKDLLITKMYFGEVAYINVAKFQKRGYHMSTTYYHSLG
jgi:hypothetical protein